MKLRGNLYIPSIDAKDIYLSNNYVDEKVPYGYKLTHKDNSDNLRKYINSFDYSLDLIELRNVAERVYNKREKLSFIYRDKEYSSKVINITYKYSVKEFNRVSKNLYVRFGYNPQNIQLNKDGYAVNKRNELIAIELEGEFYNPVPDEILPLNFSRSYDNGKYSYRLVKEFKTVINSKKLRDWTYENGFYCNGIKYCRFKRSSGSARVGKCLFIDERLYPDMHKSEQCGLDIKDGDPLDIAAFEAYISLPTSSIVDVINIEPKNILVIDDFESVFTESAVCTDLLDDNTLYTSEKDMEICNSIWDGQSLIDISLMGKYENKGMLLLRNKFFKSCCFNTNIQQFFKDNNITDISQLKGQTIATSIEDIKLITTPSSIKFFKFGDLQTWLDNIYSVFGIVKYDKNTHFFDGRLVQSHYQLLNTLQLTEDETKMLIKDSIDYVSLLNTDPDIMRYHLKFKDEYEEDVDNIMVDNNAIVYKMLGFDCDFDKTDIYYQFRRNLCRSYLKNMKRGHILIDGTYATLFGNPYEMLCQSIGTFDGIPNLEVGTVHNIRYDYNTELLCSRSPHVTIGNILVTKNVENELLDKYFNLTNNIICINSINENILERLSGADFDSDQMIISNNEILLNAAKKNYNLFKIPTRNINPEKSKRHYTKKDLADLDYKTSTNKIGEIINLSQELNSLIWDIVTLSGESVESQYEYIKEIYYDVCQLDVMSNIEIDKAKKEYHINMNNELDKIRKKYENMLTSWDGRKTMPAFLGFIAELKNYRNDEKKNYTYYNTTMDYLLKNIKNNSIKPCKNGNKKLSDIFKPKDFHNNLVNKKQLKRIVELIEKTVAYNNSIYNNNSLSVELRLEYRKRATDDLLYELNRMKISEYTMYRLLQQLESRKDMSVRNYAFYILFGYKNDTLTTIINNYPKLKNNIIESEDGNIKIYGKNYKKVTNS